ncbi:NLR family member X1 [Labeo rohita]|uniref:NLR family member X1 n=1 Tax=Labeo rohita TaxID=84645 RepID=A0ABQ8M024_LABRO|nr:NLR family member X1 [Labeo rohita]
MELPRVTKRCLLQTSQQGSSENKTTNSYRNTWKELRTSMCYSISGFNPRFFCTYEPVTADPIEIHKQKLTQWFSHLPQEERQFGGYFSPETMHVEPLVLERHPDEDRGLNPFKGKTSISTRPPLTAEKLFDAANNNGNKARGLNVLLYGAVGTGKSTVVRKLVLDWCAGSVFPQFKLVLPFSCEDLSHLSKVTSLRDLVGRKYMHLRKTPYLSGDNDKAKDVLFIFNGMEKMKLDFRIGSTELCSDPNEALPSGAVVVNLLRKYLLPEASILVTTRLSAVDRVPKKYINRYVQICGFNDPVRQRAYFTSRLLQQNEGKPSKSAEMLIEMLYLNLQRESQLATACFLPSYCWLTCATLHLLHFTDTKSPIRTLTGIYTSFMRLNFGGEVITVDGNVSSQEQQNSLMLYVVRTVGKLAFDGITNKRTSFSAEEMEQWVGGKTKTDEELQQLAVFRTDVLDFFLVPRDYHGIDPESGGRHYVFAVPAMQEYLAALYVVLGENKTVLEKLTKEVSEALGQASEDISSLLSILSKVIPFRIFAIFNLLKLFPKFFERVSSHSKGRIANTMAAEMFRSEDSFNEDVLDQVEQSLLGVHGPQPQEESYTRAFELYPIFMGGLLHYGNRRLLDQLGCSIKSHTVSQITRALRKHLIKQSQKKQPPEELMDLLVLLYEFQNPRLTAEVLQSIKTINLSTVRMTPHKCFVLSMVLSCTSSSFQLNELNLSSCHITPELLQMLWPAFHHTSNLNLQFNSLGPESCIPLRDLLLEPNCTIKSIQLCDNYLTDTGISHLLEALSGNHSLQRLSLMHTGLGDQSAQLLAERLGQHEMIQELNVAYNNIGDSAALTLVDACREHPSIHTVHLYLNQLTDVGKQSLYVRGGPRVKKGRRVKVLASVTEGSDISEDWHPILSVIGKNSLSWDRDRVREQLLVFLKDLEWGRKQHSSFWKKMHFRRVESTVRQMLHLLQKSSDTGTGSAYATPTSYVIRWNATLSLTKFTFNPKEGIDNPALVISDDTEPDVRPRLCVLKREQGQGFGFYLSKDAGCRGHVVRQVEPWSSAERGGLKNGDRVLEVNEDFVDDKEHSTVVLKVQASGLKLYLLVLSAEDYELAVSEGTDLKSLASSYRPIEGCSRPRLCYITKEPGSGLGLSIIPIEVTDGPAERAGVQNGDRLIWINGARIAALGYAALSKMVKKCEDHMTVLVIDSRSEDCYNRMGLPIIPAFAKTHNLPYTPKTLHLAQGPQGYGFLLRQEKLRSGRIAHVLREIDPCSPAETAGMEDGELVLAVNGEQVEDAEHEDIVSKIRQSGQQVTLTTISIPGRDYYAQLGISPLLFYEDHIPKREQFPNPQEGHQNPPHPRLCVLHKEGAGFGFNLGCIQNKPGTYIGQVMAGSAGERAGLCEGDVVIEVNGQNVEKEYFDEVVRLIKEGGTPLSLLVVEGLGYERLRNARQTAPPKTADGLSRIRISPPSGSCTLSAIFSTLDQL